MTSPGIESDEVAGYDFSDSYVKIFAAANHSCVNLNHSQKLCGRCIRPELLPEPEQSADQNNCQDDDRVNDIAKCN